MASGKEEGRNGAGGDGRGSCESSAEALVSDCPVYELNSSSCVLLSQIDLLVPLSPDFGGCEHATFSTHVAEGGLASAVCTSTRDTRDTCDSTT